MPANITAQMCRDLQEITSEPLMECKRALIAADGNVDGALEFLRTRPTLEQRVALLERQVRDLIEARRTPMSTYGE